MKQSTYERLQRTALPAAILVTALLLAPSNMAPKSKTTCSGTGSADYDVDEIGEESREQGR
jgi:hypothetical protein